MHAAWALNLHGEPLVRWPRHSLQPYDLRVRERIVPAYLHGLCVLQHASFCHLSQAPSTHHPLPAVGRRLCLLPQFYRSPPSDEETPQELRGADTRYYEGVAVRTNDDGTEVVRGAYQVMATFHEGLVDMDVDYEAQGEHSMPSYHKPRQLLWDRESGEVSLLTEVPNVSAWATWQGSLEGKGGLFTMEEGEAELLFR